MLLLSQGAEASIFEDVGHILKVRSPKRYRHPALDQRLRTVRTRREASLLSKSPVPAPRVISVRDTILTLSKLEGTPVRDTLDAHPELARRIGALVARLHDAHLIHGDLTTSNLIIGSDLAVLDFGLSFVSHRLEDKAVDLHLFRQALESSHYRVAAAAWTHFLAGYQPAERASILARYRIVAARGRNK